MAHSTAEAPPAAETTLPIRHSFARAAGQHRSAACSTRSPAACPGLRTASASHACKSRGYLASAWRLIRRRHARHGLRCRSHHRRARFRIAQRPRLRAFLGWNKQTRTSTRILQRNCVTERRRNITGASPSNESRAAEGNRRSRTVRAWGRTSARTLERFLARGRCGPAPQN